jgi:hypothetical protein
MRIVRIRSFLLSSDRVAIIAGTLHPNPISMGINDLPCNPIRCMILSIRKAARAIYPVSSNKAIQKNSSKIFGKNIIILPTPAMMPSTTRSFNRLAGRTYSKKAETNPTPASIHSMG